jgi:hypothetical protein
MLGFNSEAENHPHPSPLPRERELIATLVVVWNQLTITE